MRLAMSAMKSVLPTRRSARLAMAAFALSGVLSAVVVVGNVHPRSAAAAAKQSSTLSNPNLLSDPSFEQPGLRPWYAAPGQNWAVSVSYTHLARFATRFRCVSMTPLARPVVPLE